jgi:2-oxo-4-hydroxy-4-carboxy-5-ureidoimidazoline decarboxylase
MSGVLLRWNLLPPEAAANEILPCCGSRSWADQVTGRRPLADEATLLSVSDEVWSSLAEADWREAFSSHPRIGETRIGETRIGETRIGETKAPKEAAQQSAAWSGLEQSKVAEGGESAKVALADSNREYERRFGQIFIVCATGKGPEEILTILQRRLGNDPAMELREAAEQQRQITQLRLRKWLQT